MSGRCTWCSGPFRSCLIARFRLETESRWCACSDDSRFIDPRRCRNLVFCWCSRYPSSCLCTRCWCISLVPSRWSGSGLSSPWPSLLCHWSEWFLTGEHRSRWRRWWRRCLGGENNEAQAAPLFLFLFLSFFFPSPLLSFGSYVFAFSVFFCNIHV